MTRPSNCPAPSSRCGKPTTVLAAWPTEDQNARESVPEVALEDLLESSLLRSVEDLLGQHQNDVLRKAAVAREQERERTEQRRQRNLEAQRVQLEKAAELREARRAEIQRMREDLARRNARNLGAELANQKLAQGAAELRNQGEELAFAREIAQAAHKQEKRRLARWVQAAMVAAGLSAAVGFAGLQHHSQENAQELSALSLQAETMRAEAARRVSALEAQLAGHDAISAELTRELEQELEKARVALSKAEETLSSESAIARGGTTPPTPRPRRLANKSVPASSSTKAVESHEIPTPATTIASNAPDLESISLCDPHDPMCFEL